MDRYLYIEEEVRIHPNQQQEYTKKTAKLYTLRNKDEV